MGACRQFLGWATARRLRSSLLSPKPVPKRTIGCDIEALRGEGRSRSSVLNPDQQHNRCIARGHTILSSDHVPAHGTGMKSPVSFSGAGFARILLEAFRCICLSLPWCFRGQAARRYVSSHPLATR
jgi:hypothetical protein